MKKLNKNVKKIWIDPRALQLAVLKVKATLPELFSSGKLGFRDYYIARYTCDQCYKEICNVIEHVEAAEQNVKLMEET